MVVSGLGHPDSRKTETGGEWKAGKGTTNGKCLMVVIM